MPASMVPFIWDGPGFRLSHNDEGIGKAWYVPGYGLQNSSVLGYNFYIAFEI